MQNFSPNDFVDFYREKFFTALNLGFWGAKKAGR
jgi:hypothetical protein